MRLWPVVLLIALTCGLGLAATESQGDGPEYLLMTHALMTHATPDIRIPDARWIGPRVPFWARASHGLELAIHEKADSFGSIIRADDGPYYSVHFWFYSLLAVPFLALVELFRVTPWLAFGALNGVVASVGIGVLWVHFERTRFAFMAVCVFVLAGTTFYVPWTGPEALSGASALIACLRPRKGDLVGGLVAGAVASVQNASAGALLPFVLWCWWPKRRKLSPLELGGCAVAVLLTALPYAFFYKHFHIPSLTGQFATNPKLIGWERAWSFVFDLNQGLILGLPGILLGVVAMPVAVFVTKKAGGFTLLDELLPTLVLVTAMTVPTLAVHNWNMGENVIIRYGYWIAMPLTAVLLELAWRLEARLRTGLTLAVGGVQLAAIAPNGLVGQNYSFHEHSWAAVAMLRHFPQAYNPWPEIFYERTLHHEANPNVVLVLPWPDDGPPRKILRDGSRPPLDERLCPGGGLVTSDHVHDMGDDWLYLDPPFRCAPPAPSASAASPAGSAEPPSAP
ncbi:MAG TPA: hypothetical protein VMI54_20695 [Polyangiaceae bacterium]|nr:hypothetical protein [Polyangiaceae bacterium]